MDLEPFTFGESGIVAAKHVVMVVVGNHYAFLLVVV